MYLSELKTSCNKILSAHYKYKYNSLIRIYPGSNTWNQKLDWTKELWTPHSFFKRLNPQLETIQLPTNSVIQQLLLICIRDPDPTSNTFWLSVNPTKHSRICGKKQTNKNKVNGILNLVDSESKLCKLERYIHTHTSFFFCCSKKVIIKQKQKKSSQTLRIFNTLKSVQTTIFPAFFTKCYPMLNQGLHWQIQNIHKCINN